MARRKYQIARRTLEKHYGFDFKNMEEYDRFINFLNIIKNKIGLYYKEETIDDVYDLFKESERLDISLSAIAKNYEYYEAHIEDLKSAKERASQGVKVYPSQYLSKLGVESIKVWKHKKAGLERERRHSRFSL